MRVENVYLNINSKIFYKQQNGEIQRKKCWFSRQQVKWTHTSKKGVFCVTMGSHCLISKQTSSDYKLTKAHTKSRLFCDKQIYKCNLYLGEYFALACKSFFIELDFVITWIVIRQWESIVTQKTPLFELCYWGTIPGV